MNPTLKTYWDIPGFIILYLLFIIAFVLFAYRVLCLYSFLRLGGRENRLDHLGKRTKLFLGWVLGEWCALRSVTRNDWAGIGHFIMFWTFVLFFVNYAYFFVWGALHPSNLPQTETSSLSSIFYAVLDFFALLSTGGVIWALARRYIIRPKRLETNFEPAIILILIFLLMVTHLFGEALKTSLFYETSSNAIRLTFAPFFHGLNQGTKLAYYYSVWWIHIFILLGFLAYVPYSKHLHIIAALFNVFFKSLRPRGALAPINIETAERLGVERIEEFAWKQLLDLYACAECGRCQASCPAYLSGKSLSPQQLIKSLKIHLLERGRNKKESALQLIGDRVTEEKIWDCLTCYACQEVCPVCNEHIDKLLDLRRSLVMTKNRIPETTERALRMLMMRGDPWVGTQHLRDDWTKGLEIKKLSKKNDVDILYWVGCTGALDDRSMNITLSLAKLMKLAGLNFGILGSEEGCCGDPARRMGQELVFQTQVQRNIETLKRYNVKKIVASCPHGYNTFKNEYPQFGGNFEVIHHTELLAELIKNGKLEPNKVVDKKLTYHDPCYLGRYNGIYQAPRDILFPIPKIQFMELNRNKKDSFCCGGGGGHMWLEENIGKRINVIRTEDVEEVKADTVVTSCPFCLLMFEDGIKKKHLQGHIEVMDISELLEKAI